MDSRVLGAVVWIAVAASIAGWTIRIGRPDRRAEAPDRQWLAGPVDGQAVAWQRLFGHVREASDPADVASAAPLAPPGWQLVGVVATAGGRAVALIATSTKAALPYALEAEVEGGLVVRSIDPRRVRIGPRGSDATFPLDLPDPVGARSVAFASPVGAARADDGASDASPIVPPYAHMATPPAPEAGTAGSTYRRRRAEASAGGASQPVAQ